MHSWTLIKHTLKQWTPATGALALVGMGGLACIIGLVLLGLPILILILIVLITVAFICMLRIVLLLLGVLRQSRGIGIR